MKRCAVIVAAAVWLAACAVTDLTDAGLAMESACEWETASRAYDLPWNQLTDEQLYAEVRTACGRVLIGFKEAGQARGVDEKGVVLTSASTVEAMKELLRQSGVVIEHEYDMPHVAARLEPTLDRVRFLRHHPNSDYLEPIFPGTRW
jgi:hypothetical protein